MAGGWTQVTYKTQASDGGIFSTDEWTTNYDYLYVEAFIKQDGTQTIGMQFNSDTNGNSNSNYTYRYSGDFSDGATGGANGNWKIMGNYSSFEGGIYIKAFIKNTSGKQKFLTGETVESRTTSQVTSNANCPTQSWWYGSYNVTSGQINKINIVRESSSHGNILQGSWIMVSGSNALNTEDEKDSLTNVPANTRYEETDTRKIYRFSDSKEFYTSLSEQTASDGFPSSATVMGAKILSPLNSTLSGKTVTKVKFLLAKPSSGGATTGLLKSQIIDTDGSLLATSTNSVNVTSITAWGSWTTAEFNFDSVTLPSTATGLRFTVYFDSGGNGNIHVGMGVESEVNNVRSYGSASGGGATWTDQSTYEICMAIIGKDWIERNTAT